MTLIGLKNPVWLGSQAVFSPLDVPDLKLWIDIDDNSTITESSGDISQVDDKSGEGNDLSQVTGSLQPSLITAAHNGKDTMRFDGVDERIDRATFTGGELTQPNTIFIVCTMPSATLETVFDGTSSGGSTRHVFQRNTTAYQVFAGLAPTFDTVNTAFAQFNLLFNTTSSDMRRNKTNLATGISVGSETLDGFRIGANITPGQFAAIDVSEVLVYNADVSDTNRDSIETYLENKWGV